MVISWTVLWPGQGLHEGGERAGAARERKKAEKAPAAGAASLSTGGKGRSEIGKQENEPPPAEPATGSRGSPRQGEKMAVKGLSAFTEIAITGEI